MDDTASPQLIRAFRLTVDYDLPLRHDTTTGKRAFLRARAAHAEGAELMAELADEGGDWLVLRPDGPADIDGRMMLRCDDGEMVYWRSRGVLQPEGSGLEGVLSLQPWFDSEVGHRDAMTKTVYLATGTLSNQRAVLDVWRLV